MKRPSDTPIMDRWKAGVLRTAPRGRTAEALTPGRRGTWGRSGPFVQKLDIIMMTDYVMSGRSPPGIKDRLAGYRLPVARFVSLRIRPSPEFDRRET
ncbi:MAG: hypothetical protein METHAR1v1_580006 [Methanothrix sp.]|nr:MAG: hypothetical protein METHAR1v1_580006 [Methanothrix sp.]